MYNSYAYDGTNTCWEPVNVSHENQYGYELVEIDGLTVTITWYHRNSPGNYAPTSDVWSYTVRTGGTRPAPPTRVASQFFNRPLHQSPRVIPADHRHLRQAGIRLNREVPLDIRSRWLLRKPAPACQPQRHAGHSRAQAAGTREPDQRLPPSRAIPLRSHNQSLADMLRLRLVLTLIGFTAVTAQIVLMRELLCVFAGNELVLGIALGCWLLLTGLGSYGGRTASRVCCVS